MYMWRVEGKEFLFVFVCISLFLLLSSTEAKVTWVIVYYTNHSVSVSPELNHTFGVKWMPWTSRCGRYGSPSLRCWETANLRNRNGRAHHCMFLFVCLFVFYHSCPLFLSFHFSIPIFFPKLLNKFIRMGIDLSWKKATYTISVPKAGLYFIHFWILKT